MKIRILVDNNSPETLKAEWGLSIYIEYKDRKLLLDMGASDKFKKNANKLGIALADVDYAILSHAHYDHADGMDYFLKKNTKAQVYLQSCCRENCYGEHPEGIVYIGIKKGVLDQYKDRMCYVDGNGQIMPGVNLLKHSTPGLEKIGETAKLYIDDHGHLRPDNFAHEQSLIFQTEKGLVIFNSCSHAGADNIVNEVAAAFPGMPIFAMIGGFHLYKTPDTEVLEFAKRLERTGVAHVVTGHCTGDKAYSILETVLGEKLQKMCSGMELEI